MSSCTREQAVHVNTNIIENDDYSEFLQKKRKAILI